MPFHTCDQPDIGRAANGGTEEAAGSTQGHLLRFACKCICRDQKEQAHEQRHLFHLSHGAPPYVLIILLLNRLVNVILSFEF